MYKLMKSIRYLYKYRAVFERDQSIYISIFQVSLKKRDIILVILRETQITQRTETYVLHDSE
jgi:hypothetical protein